MTQLPVIDPKTEARISEPVLGTCTPPEKRPPTVYCMAGIPGSGKSTFVRRAVESGVFPLNAFVLNPDLVMDLIPAYHADHADMGAEDAFLKWESAARTLVYDLAGQAIESRLDIIKDMGLVRPENWRMLMEMRTHGYRVFLHHIMCDTEEAVRRCAARERHFPAHRIYERARELDVLMNEFSGIADRVVRFDNTQVERPYMPVSPSQGHRVWLKTA